MSQPPFAWEVHLRRDALEDALEQLRDLPYRVWTDVIQAPLTKKVKGRDGKIYTIKVTADWTYPGSEEIHVTVTLQPRWFGSSLHESFIVKPEVAPKREEDSGDSR